MTEIIDGLYIGNFDDAKNKTFLQSNRITHIVSAAWELNPSFPGKYDYLHVKMSDKPTFDLTTHLEPALEFIHVALNSSGKVLVHCYAGISRSASIVIAYLIRHKKMTLSEALNLCQSKRTQVQPNIGFMTKLKLFESSPVEMSPVISPEGSPISPGIARLKRKPVTKIQALICSHSHSFMEDD